MTVDVPSPLPPDDADAWYAPNVQAQYEPHPDVVATIRETEDGFDYDVREPVLGADGEVAMERIRDHFSTAGRRRPLTREGAVERAEYGFEPKYERVLDRLLDTSTATRRRSLSPTEHCTLSSRATPTRTDTPVTADTTVGPTS